MGSGKRIASVSAIFLVAGVMPWYSFAGETTVYQYDALGRLITTQSSGSVNNNKAQSLCFDKAGNRTRYRSSSDGSIATCAGGTAPVPPGTNRAPIAVTDYVTLTCNSGNVYTVVANDSDPDGDALSLVSASSNGGISVSVGNAQQKLVTIGTNSTPAGSYTGNYTISDGKGGAATGLINVTVTHGGPGNC